MAAKVHLEVSAASAGAIKAVEDAGGTVTCVHFNALGEDLLSEKHFNTLRFRLNECAIIASFPCGYQCPLIH
jgi:hypothetical protein